MTTAEFGKMLHEWRRESDTMSNFQKSMHLRKLQRQVGRIPTTREGKRALKEIAKGFKSSAKIFGREYMVDDLIRDYTSMGLYLTAMAETRTVDEFGRATYDMDRARDLIDATREHGALGLGNSAMTNGEYSKKAESIIKADGAVNIAEVELDTVNGQQSPSDTAGPEMEANIPDNASESSSQNSSMGSDDPIL